MSLVPLDLNEVPRLLLELIMLNLSVSGSYTMVSATLYGLVTSI